jgi:hypothetical protein
MALNTRISLLQCDASVLDAVFERLNIDPNIPFLVTKDEDVYEKRPYYYRWISITLKNKNVHEDITNIVARASSIFLASETQADHVPPGLPNGLFKHCSNLGVLVLSGCAFSFASPPFLHCHTVRFLGLDHCRDNNATELERGGCTTKWPFLKSLWVIDLYYTDWVELLSEEKIDLMDTLMEVNMEGVRWPQWMAHRLQKRVPYLRRFRIIRPMYDEAETASGDMVYSFHMDNTSLETVVLSAGCLGLKDVVLSNNSSLRSFSFDGYGEASSHRTSTVELPPVMSSPEHPPTDADKKKSFAAKISMVSLEGCTRLEKLFLRGLPNLVELNLSGCAIKVLDFGAMMVDVPNLKRLFLLGCEHLRAIRWGSRSEQLPPKQLELICIDTRPGCASSSAPSSLISAQRKSVRLQVHAIIPDARFARSLCALFISWFKYPNYCFNIRITSSDACSSIVSVVQPAATARDMLYGDIFTKVGDGQSPMQDFPQAPTEQSNHHIEIGDGSRNVQSEREKSYSYDTPNLSLLMCWFTESVHVHDVSTYSSTMPADGYERLRWCRVERCPRLHAVFPPDSVDNYGRLETIWVSDLLLARCVWSKGRAGRWPSHLKGLKHLHLCRCPSLRFALAMGRSSSLPSLETLHIIYCGDLKHIFIPGNKEEQHTSVEFPKLTTIHLHDLPALEQICEAAEMVAPALETMVIKGCWSLRRLPALKGREPGMRKPAVEIEKDVWDALEWDGVDAGHHPSLYEAPVHSRYYKRRFIRRTVLRYVHNAHSIT